MFPTRSEPELLLLSQLREEANRLLEQVAEPLLEKQDVRLESDLLDGEELANSIDSLVESLETNTPKDKPSADTGSNNP